MRSTKSNLNRSASKSGIHTRILLIAVLELVVLLLSLSESLRAELPPYRAVNLMGETMATIADGGSGSVALPPPPWTWTRPKTRRTCAR